ncbi:integral membrane protein [Lactiplantibacillus plantarum]|nr:integral membrane protein [Lactiplantibacillus plantarum]MCG0599465.1 integral membrane protein [Lactiplantibacillus plantarum]MCG0602463.1 integral membrane protein [Lactiplantibacillus plantarum]MCG0605386.1 integral membrane protein [Lactiplantibacillus plantarum]MCG0742952.1 integral membrane protein [Lactiplantibacillus plantarum]
MTKRNLQLWLSYIVILLPMSYGVVNYAALPAKMAIHFNLDNR